MRLRSVIPGTLGLVSLACMAIAAESLDEYRARKEQEMRAYERSQAHDIKRFGESQARAKALHEEEYRQYQQESDRKRRAYFRHIDSLWGKHQTSTATVFSAYSVSDSEAVTVDFEEGYVTVSVVVDTGVSEQQIRSRISDALVSGYTGATEPSAGTTIPELLAGQLDLAGGTVVREADFMRFADTVLSRNPIQREPASTGQAERVSVQFPLIPDHLNVRAQGVLPLVERYSRQYGIAPAHVLATIHTESHFNSRARSHADAIGLMQLVPEYGAREAYRFVHGDDRIPTDAFLFDPENNIRLGTAYMHILDSLYFGSVTDSVSRLYCVIAAYNTGPHNVARAFTGHGDLSCAITEINETGASDLVLSRLLKGLPYAETRDYVKAVTQRIPAYARI